MRRLARFLRRLSFILYPVCVVSVLPRIPLLGSRVPIPKGRGHGTRPAGIRATCRRTLRLWHHNPVVVLLALRSPGSGSSAERRRRPARARRHSRWPRCVGGSEFLAVPTTKTIREIEVGPPREVGRRSYGRTGCVKPGSQWHLGLEGAVQSLSRYEAICSDHGDLAPDPHE